MLYAAPQATMFDEHGRGANYFLVANFGCCKDSIFFFFSFVSYYNSSFIILLYFKVILYIDHC